jgi:hypothetical protein
MFVINKWKSWVEPAKGAKSLYVADNKLVYIQIMLLIALGFWM